METEIEIKFFFNADFTLALYDKINLHRVLSTKKQNLNNVYFDTTQRLFRKMDMGLRVRTCENKSVQTIKTAGRVIGGLHQRPEYNQPIEGLRPELARFKEKIWPLGCDIQALQDDLLPLFRTDFNRQTWLIEMPEDTLIEVAYDSGFIETNKGKQDICEIELELLKGDQNQLFVLGKDIATLPQVRLGNVSKAQRGYMMVDGASFKVKPLLSSPLTKSMSAEQALMVNLQHGLQHIQYHEYCYLDCFDDAALYELVRGVKFLHQNLKIFKNTVPQVVSADWLQGLHWLAGSLSWLDERFIVQSILEDNGFYIRKLPQFKAFIKNLEKQHNALPDQQAMQEILTSTGYCQFVLALTQWLIQFEKNTAFNEKSNSIESFSKAALDLGWKGLKQVESNNAFSIKQLLSYQDLLESNLLLGTCVDTLFPVHKSAVFYSPWLDMKQAIKELAMVKVVAESAQLEPDKVLQNLYLQWVKRKQDSLLYVLQQSKEQAMSKESYWHNNQT